MSERFEKLRMLLAEATPTPWSRIPQSRGDQVLIAHRYDTGNQMSPEGLRLVGFVMQRGNSLVQDRANGELIEEARNQLPEVLAALDAAEARNATYRDIFAEITAKATALEFSAEDPDRITAYRIACGPLHRAAGKVGFQMFDGEKHLAQALADKRAAEARVKRIEEALEAQIEAHRMLCKAAGLDQRAHLDGTAQARAALAKEEGGR